MYTNEEINYLRLAARYYRLSAPVEWERKAEEWLVRVCNGCGPERWPEAKRQALTKALRRYESCFAIHDVDYEIKTKRSEADRRLRANMIKVWRKDFGLWRWLSRAGRAERLVVIPAVFAAVVLAGGAAYESGKGKGDE